MSEMPRDWLRHCSARPEVPGYGYRRVSAQRQREGWAINHKQVLWILRE
jgi:hypothetical protein